MDDSAASIDHLVGLVGELIAHLGVGPEFLQEPLEALIAVLRAAVGSFLGVQMVLVIDGHPVRLSLFEPAVSFGTRPPIATSLQIPLRVFALSNGPGGGSIDGDSTITFYAATPGAFVDLAADLDYTLTQPRPRPESSDTGPVDRLTQTHRVSLDRHLVPVSLVSGLVGLAELSVINTAVGVLIDRGHHPDDAPVELRRRADADGVSSHAYAAGLLRSLVQPRPPDDHAERHPPHD